MPITQKKFLLSLTMLIVMDDAALHQTFICSIVNLRSMSMSPSYKCSNYWLYRFTIFYKPRTVRWPMFQSKGPRNLIALPKCNGKTPPNRGPSLAHLWVNTGGPWGTWQYSIPTMQGIVVVCWRCCFSKFYFLCWIFDFRDTDTMNRFLEKIGEPASYPVLNVV